MPALKMTERHKLMAYVLHHEFGYKMTKIAGLMEVAQSTISLAIKEAKLLIEIKNLKKELDEIKYILSFEGHKSLKEADKTYVVPVVRKDPREDPRIISYNESSITFKNGVQESECLNIIDDIKLVQYKEDLEAGLIPRNNSKDLYNDTEELTEKSRLK